MNPMYIVALLCVLGAASATSWEEYDDDDDNQGHGHGHHEGQWKGEGLADSQWHGEGHDASQWHKEGLADSQDHGDQGGYHKYGPAPLGHDGRVVDTDDVAHAKSFHHAAHAAASQGHGGHGGYGGNGGHGGHGGHGHGSYAPESHHGQYTQGKWHGPLAHIELTHDGKYVKDTPEVAHARAQHFAALSAGSHGNGYHGGHHSNHGKW